MASTVRRLLKRLRIPPAARRSRSTWRQFLRTHLTPQKDSIKRLIDPRGRSSSLAPPGRADLVRSRAASRSSSARGELSSSVPASTSSVFANAQHFQATGRLAGRRLPARPALPGLALPPFQLSWLRRARERPLVGLTI